MRFYGINATRGELWEVMAQNSSEKNIAMVLLMALVIYFVVKGVKEVKQRVALK